MEQASLADSLNNVKSTELDPNDQLIGLSEFDKSPSEIGDI